MCFNLLINRQGCLYLLLELSKPPVQNEKYMISSFCFFETLKCNYLYSYKLLWGINSVLRLFVAYKSAHLCAVNCTLNTDEYSSILFNAIV